MTGDARYIVASIGVAVLIAAVGVGVVYEDQPATDAGKSTKTVERARPEYAPPAADTIPGDGTWVIGKEIRRGTYRTGGRVGCYWQRLQAHPSGRWLIVDSAQRDVAQTVVLGPDDAAFDSQGCAPWVLVP